VAVITVREMHLAEARVFLSILGRAVRGLAASHYPEEVLDAWVVPLTDASIGAFLENRLGEIRLIAELDGEPAGIGALIVATSEIRACYVSPPAARKGVGAAIVNEIERIARQHGLDQLHLHASLNAQPFYVALGYQSDGLIEHTLPSGHRITAIAMSKALG
jgi:putative acetyltransferase